MSTLIRTGISLESDLLERFDRVIHKKGYKNRSEAIRDLVRDYAVAEDVEENRTVVGTLTMVYDHHRPKLSEQLIEAQHHAENKVLAATHVHLDHHNCLEVIIMRGRSSEVQPDRGSDLEPAGGKAWQTRSYHTGEKPVAGGHGFAAGPVLTVLLLIVAKLQGIKTVPHGRAALN